MMKTTAHDKCGWRNQLRILLVTPIGCNFTVWWLIVDGSGITRVKNLWTVLKIQVKRTVWQNCCCFNWLRRGSNTEQCDESSETRNRQSILYVIHIAHVILINLLKPTGYVMHQQFNVQQLYALPTLYLSVLYLSENKQRLVPLTA